jgi:Sulfotransferase family
MFLVFGQPRSGTTLVAQCLNVHPELVVPDETDVVIPLAFLLDRVKDPEVGRDLAARLVVSTERFEPSLGRYLSAEDAARVVREAPYTLVGILDALYAAVAKAGGGRLGGDKSPNDLKYVRALVAAGLFTDAVSVIHVVRDVRDVMASFTDLGWADGVAEGMVRHWVANNLVVASAVPRQGSPYLLVRYEDVVSDPRGQMRNICALLGLEFDEAMVDDEARFAQFEAHRGMAQHAQTFEPITPDRIGRHREVFDADAIARMDRLAADGLEAFGYS